jgi:hypothetical protein
MPGSTSEAVTTCKRMGFIGSALITIANSLQIWVWFFGPFVQVLTPFIIMLAPTFWHHTLPLSNH